MARMRSRILVACLAAAYPLLVGYGGPNAFHVARLLPSGANFQPGNWVESTSVSSKDEITVVLMASWCPHCARMIDQLDADRAARDRVDMVLLFDDENGPAAQQGDYVKYPDKIANRDLPYFFAKKGEFAGLYQGFPTILTCSRQGCTSRSRADLGLH
jgi:thiol-disulfide isomerase/thioredoxin